MRDSVYLDHAATTPLAPEVLQAMRPFFAERFGNPSSVHAQGRAARHAVEDSRLRVAEVLGCEAGEIIFTSGGTEANNLAIFGSLRRSPHLGLITSSVEHESVLRPAQALADAGHPVRILEPDAAGRVSVEQVRRALGAQVALVSLMWVNNELGTVLPVSEVAAVCREQRVAFHTDAVQAAGLFGRAACSLGMDMLSLSAHKIGGPKGVGLLYVRGGASLDPHILGGSQERRRRAGTENVPGIVGLAAAIERAAARAEQERARLGALRQQLIAGLRERFPEAVRFNSPLDADAAPHILNFSFRHPAGRPLDGEMLLLGLDLAGVMLSSGSACASGAVEPSHVLRGIQLPPELAAATVRVSMGDTTMRDDIAALLRALGQVLGQQGVAAHAARTA